MWEAVRIGAGCCDRGCCCRKGHLQKREERATRITDEATFGADKRFGDSEKGEVAQPGESVCGDWRNFGRGNVRIRRGPDVREAVEPIDAQGTSERSWTVRCLTT